MSKERAARLKRLGITANGQISTSIKDAVEQVNREILTKFLSKHLLYYVSTLKLIGKNLTQLKKTNHFLSEFSFKA